MADVHERIRDWWNADAHTYDAAKSHAISDPLEAAAWRQALREAVPRPEATVLDVGAGTGALALLAAELGYRVTALDLSPEMLGKAERKARERGLGSSLTFVVGPADEPPPGPFDAVIERHVLWTLPDPTGALRAWRAVASRLVVFEGLWGGTDPGRRVKDAAAGLVRKLMQTPPDHHAPYPEDVLAELPLAGMSSPIPMIRTVEEAGWTAVRFKRLRDVEWAAGFHEGRALGWLERRPRYVLVAES